MLEEILPSGITAIKEDAELTGNEIVIVPLQAGVIAPIVGGRSVPSLIRVSSTTQITFGVRGLLA